MRPQHPSGELRQLHNNNMDQLPIDETAYGGVRETGLIAYGPRIRLLQPMQDLAPCLFQGISSLSEAAPKSCPALLSFRSSSPDLMTGMLVPPRCQTQSRMETRRIKASRCEGAVMVRSKANASTPQSSKSHRSSRICCTKIHE